MGLRRLNGATLPGPTSAALDDRVLGRAILVGAVLAALANGLHPFIASDATSLELLTEVTATSYWLPLHVSIGVSIVLLTGSLVVVLGQALAGSLAARARVAIALAILGGTIFTLQIVAVDGGAFVALAGALEAGNDPASVVAAAEAMRGFDVALLGIVVAVFFGATFVVGAKVLASLGRYASWIITVARIAGWSGLVIGIMMLFDVAGGFTFWAFRVVALLVTVVTFGLGVTHYRAGDISVPTAMGTSAG